MKEAKMFLELGDLLNALYVRRHGQVKTIVVGKNLLDQPTFKTVTFSDGFVATFNQGHYGQWFRNEQKARKPSARQLKAHGKLIEQAGQVVRSLHDRKGTPERRAAIKRFRELIDSPIGQAYYRDLVERGVPLKPFVKASK